MKFKSAILACGILFVSVGALAARHVPGTDFLWKITEHIPPGRAVVNN
jgi:hypothetical protein